MRLKLIYTSIIIALIFAFSGHIVLGEEGQDDKEQMAQYAKELESYISEYIKDIDASKEYIEKEGNKFTDFNTVLTDTQQDVLSVMKQMLSAARKGDKATLEKLEAEKMNMEHKIEMISLRKDMLMTLDDMTQQAKNYPNNAKIKASIQDLDNAYLALIKAAEEAFNATQTLNKMTKRKEDAYKKCEIHFLEAEKQQKINELKNR